ncbi:hypothetical protein NBG4_250031 [Candidatus Sulfobium mesophilum]|uniref:Helix-turn-helix domain-containing protein n=1 Tax=Candidatus Sulfobium mesophilum TaxID=2016548 RepID=A0A2U3QGL1_9BACT|nr:hypothetical protein NBG4_250031 [Candidatus Sulfobium mesophilum]
MTELNDDENELLKKNGLPVKTRYTAKELSHSLKVNVKTVYGWQYTGKYDGEKIGGARFYSIGTVLSILQDSTTL